MQPFKTNILILSFNKERFGWLKQSKNAMKYEYLVSLTYNRWRYIGHSCEKQLKIGLKQAKNRPKYGS